MKNRKRAVSLLCAILLLCAPICMTAFAADEPQVDWLIPQMLKIGYTPDTIVNVKNLPSELAGKNVTIATADSELFKEYNLFGHCFSPHAYGRESVAEGGDARIYFRYGSRPVFKPGTFTMQMKICETNTTDVIATVGEPYTVTIEEPVIESNAPQRAAIGEKLSFSAQLTNTLLENGKVADYQTPEFDVHKVAYQPSIEILEGQDLVTLSNPDCSNILSAGADLTFLKEGTVKIKVRFQQLQTCSEHSLLFGDQFNEGTYNPEKIFTINVADVLTGVKVKAPAKTEYLVGDKLDTTGMVVSAIYKNSGEKAITEGFTLSDVDMSTPGEKNVTVTFEGKSDSFAITVKKKPQPPVIDKTVLEQLIKDLEKYSKAEYTEKSWKAFASALQDAMTVLGSGTATPDEIQEAISALNNAAIGLVKLGASSSLNVDSPNKGGDLAVPPTGDADGLIYLVLSGVLALALAGAAVSLKKRRGTQK